MDESGLSERPNIVRTWAPKGQTPVIQVPGQRQKVSAASAVNSKGGFWYATSLVSGKFHNERVQT